MSPFVKRLITAYTQVKLHTTPYTQSLSDDEPDHLSWRSTKTRDQEPVQTVHLVKQLGTGFGFSLVTIDKNVYVRRLQPYSPASALVKYLSLFM